MIDGKLSWDELKIILSGRKDSNRFDLIIEILQDRMPWKEKIILPLHEHLQIVSKEGQRIVKCDCGHEFGDYKENWKTKCRVRVRDTFEEIATFISGAERGKEIGVCFDTQHAFASGYDLRTKANVDKTFKDFDKIVGLKKLILSHCNDSKTELDSHKDRHEHLGKGLIGLKGVEAIVKHPKLGHLDLILETPFDDDGVKEDLEILKKLRK